MSINQPELPIFTLQEVFHDPDMSQEHERISNLYYDNKISQEVYEEHMKKQKQLSGRVF